MTGLQISARQVPALVGAHQDYLRGEAYQQFAGGFYNRMLTLVSETDPHMEKFSPADLADYGRAWCEGERNRLNISALFHITDSMTQVAKFAAEKLPEDAAITVDLLPSRCGVLVFERSVHMLDAWQRRMGVFAVTWYVDTGGGVNFHLYTDIEDPEDDYNRVLKAGNAAPVIANMGRWSLSHVSTVTATTRLGPWMTNESPEIVEYRASHPDSAAKDEESFGLPPSADETLVGTIPLFANFSHVLYSIFSLMDQTIVQLSEEHDRKLARRWQHKRRPPTMVTVIALRRKDYHGYHEPNTGTWLTYRSVTRGHWRMQPCGPGRCEVKRIWINPYMRGGPDLPFYQPNRVSTLAR